METNRILGIDPGSRCTGYGIIEVSGSTIHCITYGQVRPPAKTSIDWRLEHIRENLCAIIEAHQPNQAAVEQIFSLRHHQSALKLGQARGVALAAIAKFALPLSEYPPRQIKKSVVGYGAADKNQIQKMVSQLLKLRDTPPTDAADALAVALCHANHSRWQTTVNKALGILS